VKGSASAIKALTTGQPLTTDHKQSLKAVASKVVEIALDNIPGGAAAKLLSRVGIKLVYIGFSKMRNSKSDVKDHSKSIVDSLLEALMSSIGKQSK
jgi:hypothetical protein